MRRLLFFIGFSLIAVAFFGNAALAQSKGKIKLNAVAEVEKEIFNEEGKKVTKRFPADKVIPGDKVIFTVYYTNASKDKADDVFITNHIPEHMIYSEGTATGEDTRITFSIDGGKRFDLPENLKMKMPDGTERLARPEEYTTVKWTFNKSLPAGSEGAVAFTAILK